jgi:N utilization substance protein B
MNESGEPADEQSQEHEAQAGNGAPERAHGKKPASQATGRHRGRTLVLQALYEADTSGHDPAGVVERLVLDENVGHEPAEFARSLIEGIKRSRKEIDQHIRESAPQWPVEQLAVVDRNVLRIAIYELLFERDTPVRVAVNEAVELAKAFGSATSGRFINGVLGAVAPLRPE